MGACWGWGRPDPLPPEETRSVPPPQHILMPLACTHSVSHFTHPSMCLTQLPIFSGARKLEARTGAGPGVLSSGEGSEGKTWVFLGHPLPLHQLVAGPDTSPPCPKPQHSNSLPHLLWAHPAKGQGPRLASSLFKSSKGLQSGADRAKHRYSQCCELKAGLGERVGVGSTQLSLGT